MFKKTRVRQFIELLQKNLNDREISNVLGVTEILLWEKYGEKCKKEGRVKVSECKS